MERNTKQKKLVLEAIHNLPHPTAQDILNYIKENGGITDLQIQELLDLKKTRAFNLAKQMREMELITSIGRGSEKKYVLHQ